MAELLQEYVDSRGVTLRVDREAGVLRGVKVLGLESKNGRTYLPEALSQAIGLYEGAKVNVNHPKGNPSDPRDYRDRMGVIRNVENRAGEGLFGDFHFNPKHALAEQLIWDAEHSPDNVGFSHNVEAKLGRRDGKTVVEQITRVQSVDLVADPATTRGLFEGVNSKTKESEVDYANITEADLRTNRPDLFKSIAEQALTEHANSEAEKARGEKLKALTEEVEALKAEKAKFELAKTIEAELTEAKLPASAVTEVFRGQLMSASDKEARAALIEDRRKLVGTATGKPVSKEQHIAEGVDGHIEMDAKQFARTLMRR